MEEETPIFTDSARSKKQKEYDTLLFDAKIKSILPNLETSYTQLYSQGQKIYNKYPSFVPRSVDTKYNTVHIDGPNYLKILYNEKIITRVSDKVRITE